MPKRRRAQEAARAARRAEEAAAPKRRRSQTPKKKGPRSKPDPSDVPDADVRFVSAADATKPYLCPGCGRDIPPGMGHVVAVPPDAPDLRRHWHRGCWEHRRSRR
ncbi:MAG: ATP/GTP-binding protein [Acidimicrobiales bacterium]